MGLCYVGLTLSNIYGFGGFFWQNAPESADRSEFLLYIGEAPVT